MLFRIITWAIVIGFIYRFVVRFLFPVFHITKVTSERMRQMQKQMEEMQQKSNANQSPPQAKEGDYIDYEEVK